MEYVNPRDRGLQGKSLHGTVYGDGRCPYVVRAEDRHSDSIHAFDELSTVKSVIVAANICDVGKKRGRFDMGVRRQSGECESVDEGPAFGFGQASHEHLAAGGAVEGHVAADRQLDAQRPVSLNAIERMPCSSATTKLTVSRTSAAIPLSTW